jgi:hypothetical protein
MEDSLSSAGSVINASDNACRGKLGVSHREDVVLKIVSHFLSLTNTTGPASAGPFVGVPCGRCGRRQMSA